MLPEDQAGEGGGSQAASLKDLQAQLAELAKALERTTTRLQRMEEAATEGTRGRHASRRRADLRAGSSEEGRPRRARKAARQATSPEERSDPAIGEEADTEELEPPEEPHLEPAKTARNAPDKGGKSARSGARSKAQLEGHLQVMGEARGSSDLVLNPVENERMRDAVVLATAIASAIRDLDAKGHRKSEGEEVIDLSTPAPVSPREFAGDEAMAAGYVADEAQAAEAKWEAELAASGAWDLT